MALRENASFGLVRCHTAQLLPSNGTAYTVASIPAASADNLGSIAYVSDGAAGSAILAFSDGTNWKRSDTGATIAAS